MSRLEHHAAAFAHFLLYAAMILMPLSGWLMISANPPAGSAGQRALLEMVTAKFGMRGFAPGAGSPPPLDATAASPPPALGGGAPAGATPVLRPKPKTIKIWFVMPFKPIGVIEQLGATADSYRSQDVLHEWLIGWHKKFGWLMVFLLVLHVLGALKHQYMDKQPSLQRMGFGGGP